MISGAGPSSKPAAGNSGAAPQAGATRLFTGESSAPTMAPLPAGPSEYTRIVSARQLKELQQAASPANNPAPAPPTGQIQGLPGVPQTPTWPIVSAPPMPTAAPAPQLTIPPVPHWQPPQVPSALTALPPAPAAASKPESKILTYLPLIIGLNVLFLIAVLLILLFALKR